MASVTTPPPPAPTESPSLSALSILAQTRAGLDARLIEAALITVADVSGQLLADKGFASVEELTPSQRDKLRAEAKTLACADIDLRLGLGAYETRIVVGLACSPVRVRELVIGALDKGWATWPQVKAYWQRCGSLPADAAELVADSLFGNDPSCAAKERLDPDGRLAELPWQHAEFRAALDREAVAAEGADVAAERARRRAAYQGRSMGLTYHDDGTASLTITGALVTLCAIHTRIERVARLLRKHGDPRTLDQLRVDVASALLLHGTVPLLDKDPNEMTPGDLDKITQVINALPAVNLQVIIPWDTLTDSAACPHCCESLGTPPDAGATAPPSDESTAAPPDAGTTSPPDAGTTAPPHAPSRGSVGELLGAHPTFITPGHIRELALQPGTTMSRLMTDPGDGRLIGMSRESYRPDPAMRAQIAAADVYSRSPGSRHPMASCELDHVVPWGTPHYGPTSPDNLVGLAKRPHDLKTRGHWSSAINERRDLTWTTLLGQVIVTRMHDYRQYHGTPRPHAITDESLRAGVDDLLRRAVERAAPLDPTQDEFHPSERTDLDERRDLANRAMYAAIAHRGPGAFLAADDDHIGSTDHGGRLAGWAWVTHTSPTTGRRRPGPPRSPETVEDVLELRREGPEARPAQEGQDGDRLPGSPWSRRASEEPPPF